MKVEDSFFNHQNSIDHLSEEEIEQKYHYLEPVKAFARTTYTSVYIIDYLNRNFEYVSDNPLFLCGNTAKEVQEMGYAFYFKHVPENDLKLLLKINTIGFDFYEKIPIQDRLNYTISYDFHLITKDNKKLLINQKLTPVYLTHSGKIWKAICIISLSAQKSAGNVKIYKNGENLEYHYNFDLEAWQKMEQAKLSKREIEILHYSTRGYTINEIADAIFVSPDTVKFHRRKLFEKLGVTNITEAIICATNNKLI
jgi:DNA-binding CsgD family transcriptional regulator